MKKIDTLLNEYGESHQNRINRKIHWVCVPAILFSLLAVLWSLPVPVKISPFVNWATVLVSLSVVYYFFLSWQLAIGTMFYSVFMILILQWMDGFIVPLWQFAVAIFMIAWVGQFIGHHIEGKRPSFFKDIQFLLIGPVWLLADVYKRFHLRY